MIASGFNVITKGIFKALCSSHDYYVPDMDTSVITSEAESCMLSFSVCFMCRYYSVITHSSITSDFADILHLFFQNFVLCFHSPIFLKILLAKSAHP